MIIFLSIVIVLLIYGLFRTRWKLEELRREFDLESTRERAVRQKAINDERLTRKAQLSNLRSRIYKLDRKLHDYMYKGR